MLVGATPVIVEPDGMRTSPSRSYLRVLSSHSFATAALPCRATERTGHGGRQRGQRCDAMRREAFGEGIECGRLAYKMGCECQGRGGSTGGLGLRLAYAVGCEYSGTIDSIRLNTLS